MDMKELELLYNKRSPLYNDAALKNLIYQTLQNEGIINKTPNPPEKISSSCDNTVSCTENSTQKRKQTSMEQSEHQDFKGKCSLKKKGIKLLTDVKEVTALDDKAKNPQWGIKDEDLSHCKVLSDNLSECVGTSNLKPTISVESKFHCHNDTTSFSVVMTPKTVTSSITLASVSYSSTQDERKSDSISSVSGISKNLPLMSTKENNIEAERADYLFRELPDIAPPSENTSFNSSKLFKKSDSSCSGNTTCCAEPVNVLEGMPYQQIVCDDTHGRKNITCCKPKKSNLIESLNTSTDQDKFNNACSLCGACDSYELASTKNSAKSGTMEMVESKLATSKNLNLKLGTPHREENMLATAHVLESMHGIACDMKSKDGTACAMKSMHGTACDMKSKDGTACDMKSMHGTACDMKSMHGTACDMKSMHGTACDMKSKDGTACDMKSMHGTGDMKSKDGTVCAVESKHRTAQTMESEPGTTKQQVSKPNGSETDDSVCEMKKTENKMSKILDLEEINHTIAVLVKANGVFKEFPKNGDSDKKLLMQKQNEFLETAKLKNADPEMIAKHEEETRKRLLEVTVDYIEMRITESVKFAKKIPGFVQLPLDDQVNLVKESRTESGIIGGMRGINSSNQVFTSHSGHFFTLQDMRLVFSQNLLRQTMVLSKKIAALDLSPAEEALLRAITIVASDRCPLSSISQIEKIQQKLFACLEHVITSGGKTPAGPRLGKLMDVLISCRDVTEVDMKEVKGILLEWPSFSKYKLVEEFL